MAFLLVRKTFRLSFHFHLEVLLVPHPDPHRSKKVEAASLERRPLSHGMLYPTSEGPQLVTY